MKNIKTTANQAVFFSIVCASLLMVPGCGPLNWFKKKSDAQKTDDQLLFQGDELVTMGGSRIISEKSLDRDFEQLLDENPQLKSVLPLMPDARYNFLQGMVSQAVVDRYVADNKIDQSAEYTKELEQMMRSVKRMLNTKYFGMANPIEVSDADVQQYYEENKATMPDLLVSHGGVKAEGVMFETEAAAKAFAASAHGKNFTQVAKAQKLDAKLQDFKFVNEQSLGMNATLRSKIVAMNSFPTTEVIKADDKAFWVVRATEKQEAKYRPLEQIQAALKQYVEKERRMAMFDKEITRLKEEYKVVVNEDYFKKQHDQQLAQSNDEADEISEGSDAQMAQADMDSQEVAASKVA